MEHLLALLQDIWKSLISSGWEVQLFVGIILLPILARWGQGMWKILTYFWKSILFCMGILYTIYNTTLGSIMRVGKIYNKSVIYITNRKDVEVACNATRDVNHITIFENTDTLHHIFTLAKLEDLDQFGYVTKDTLNKIELIKYKMNMA